MDLNQFRNYGRRAFRFLIEEYGYSEAPLPEGEFVNQYMVCFSNGVTWIGVEGINWGFGIDIRLASHNPGLMQYPTYCLDDLLALRDPGFMPITAKPTDKRDIQKSQMDQYADALRQHADDILRGDFSVFPQLAEAINRRRRQNNI
jgi:hypothetical protein